MARTRSPQSIGDPDRRLAAVWFCDVVGSTEIAEELGDRRLPLADRSLPRRCSLGDPRRRAVARSTRPVTACSPSSTPPPPRFKPRSKRRPLFEIIGIEIRSGVHLGEVEQDPDGQGRRHRRAHRRARCLARERRRDLHDRYHERARERCVGSVSNIEAHTTLKGLVGFFMQSSRVVEVDGQRARAIRSKPDEAARRRAAASAVARSLRSMRASYGVGPGRGAGSALRRSRSGSSTSCYRRSPMPSAGHGSLFLISGEPGIGKSRLMERGGRPRRGGRLAGADRPVLGGRRRSRVLAVDPGGPSGRRGVRRSRLDSRRRSLGRGHARIPGRSESGSLPPVRRGRSVPRRGRSRPSVPDRARRPARGGRAVAAAASVPGNQRPRTPLRCAGFVPRD